MAAKELLLSAALALPLSWFKRDTDADKAMLAFLQAMGNVHRLKKHDPAIAWSAEPGSFVVVKGKPDLWDWYRAHGFQRMPFYWRRHQIFRKMGASA